MADELRRARALTGHGRIIRAPHVGSIPIVGLTAIRPSVNTGEQFADRFTVRLDVPQLLAKVCANNHAGDAWNAVMASVLADGLVLPGFLQRR